MSLVEADVEQLGALFHAEGEGLPEQVITSVIAPVEELLTVLQLDTSILIANFKQASHHALGVPQSLTFERFGGTIS